MAQIQSGNAGSWQPPGWLRVLVMGRNPRMTLVRVVVLVVTCFVVFKFILVPVRVSGISMLPTYPDRSVNFSNRLAYLRHAPRRGDVVNISFNPEVDATKTVPHEMLMKRIIGLPGETVAFVDGRVVVDGTLLAEPYEKWPCDWNASPVKLGSAEYYVVGDNRTMPIGNHEHGVARRNQIVGKILL